LFSLYKGKIHTADVVKETPVTVTIVRHTDRFAFDYKDRLSKRSLQMLGIGGTKAEALRLALAAAIVKRQSLMAQVEEQDRQLNKVRALLKKASKARG